MRPEDLPRSRSPIGESPRWVVRYTFGGLAIGASLMLLYALPDGAHSEVRWVQAIVPVMVLAAYARAYAPRRHTLEPVDLSYLRYSIALLVIPGLPGTLPLTLVAGPAFLIWTVIERRRA